MSQVQEEKNDITHVESNIGDLKYDAVGDAAAKGQIVTGYENLGIIQTMLKFKVAMAICFAATFAGATDGYQIGLNGNVIANDGFIKQFATTTDSDGNPILAASVLTAIGSIQSVGQIIGMCTLPFVASRFGRKPAMFTLWLVLALSVTCETVAKKWQVWFVAKLFSGIGVGSLQFITPTYVTEISPARIRGLLLVMYNFWFSVGSFFASIALQSMFTKDPYNYKTPIYTQWAHIGLMLAIYLCLPETPAWLASQGKADKAKKNLKFIYRDVPDFNADQYYDAIVSGIEHEQEVARQLHRGNWYDALRGVDGFRTIVSTWALFSQQLLGLTLFYTYASVFFSAAGFDDPFAITCITNGIQLVVIVLVAISVDRIGRRNICCGGLTTMLVGITLIGIVGVLPNRGKAANSLLVFFCCIYMVGLQCSGSTGWAYVGEISSQRLRPYTAGFAAALSCVMGVIMNVLVPYMLTVNEWNWGLKTAFFYLGLGAPFAIASWFLIPETARLTAPELDELFENKVRPWRFHKTKTALQLAVEAQSS